MHDIHATEEELILKYYGESDDQRLEAHISSCTQCTRALDELRAVLSLVDAQPLAEPLAGLEQRVWARVKPAIAGQTSRWSRWFAGAPAWALAGGLAVVVVAAFIAGRATRPDVALPANSTATVATTSTPSQSNERLMTVAVGDHLDQSQMVLMELLNGDARPIDLGNEQERARDLVAANRLYRQIAVREGDQGIGEVLDALERVLVEIANAPPDVSARELKALRDDIVQRGILFRLRVVTSEMRARQQKDVTGSPQTGP
jgi:anti-sigma-K factor RskA